MKSIITPPLLLLCGLMTMAAAAPPAVSIEPHPHNPPDQNQYLAFMAKAPWLDGYIRVRFPELLFPRLRSGHRHFQRPSSQKQFLSSQWRARTYWDQRSLARINHRGAAHLANHLAARAVGFPHQITVDMPRSAASSGNQSVTQSVSPLCHLSGLVAASKSLPPPKNTSPSSSIPPPNSGSSSNLPPPSGPRASDTFPSDHSVHF
jgi:hypothetical protein